MSELIPTNVQLHNFIDDLEKCLSNYNFEKKIDCDNIVLSGMGGSAISGNVVADYCFEKSKIPVVCVMNTSLPNWVNGRTLAIISSYSGNTLETLESYKDAQKLGCQIVVITAGGILERLAKKYDNPLIMLPDNLHPRHSIGYMIGYIFAVIRATGAIKYPRDLFYSIGKLKQYRDSLEDKENGPAMEMAKYYLNNVPVILSYSRIQSIIFRWKTQFNENSKYVAFCSTIPEFAYSELKGWVNGRRDNYKLTIIVENDVDNDEYVTPLIRYLDDNGVKYKLVPLGGLASVENALRALMLGDYTSMYMAELQGIDPSGVPPITLLKTKLKPLIKERTKDL